MRRYIAVISDLHVGEGVLDDFDSEIEGHLVTFLQWLGARPDPAELIINGDFLDFAQASPWRGKKLEGATVDGAPLCFTERQSVDKFEAIRDAHPNTFDALRHFLAAQDGNRLVIMPGNHDVDFFWPCVRRRFIQACAPGRSRTAREYSARRVYRPDAAPWLWIEHGHQYDPVNAFFVDGEERWSAEKPPITTAADGTQRSYAPRPLALFCSSARLLTKGAVRGVVHIPSHPKRSWAGVLTAFHREKRRGAPTLESTQSKR